MIYKEKRTFVNILKHSLDKESKNLLLKSKLTFNKMKNKKTIFWILIKINQFRIFRKRIKLYTKTSLKSRLKICKNIKTLQAFFNFYIT